MFVLVPDRSGQQMQMFGTVTSIKELESEANVDFTS